MDFTQQGQEPAGHMPASRAPTAGRDSPRPCFHPATSEHEVWATGITGQAPWRPRSSDDPMGQVTSLRRNVARVATSRAVPVLPINEKSSGFIKHRDGFGFYPPTAQYKHKGTCQSIHHTLTNYRVIGWAWNLFLDDRERGRGSSWMGAWCQVHKRTRTTQRYLFS